MRNIVKIAIRNLLRYKRRTLLTASLITIGVIFVLVFVSVSSSFKGMITGQITDSMLGHIQVHRKGYVSSIDNLPLNLSLKPQAVNKIERAIKQIPEIESYSLRTKFGGMFSNFLETSNIRINAVYYDEETKTVPLLSGRIIKGKKTLAAGEVFVPDLLARGMKVAVGDTVVVVATNKDGSVNGKALIVSGILESVTGPGGRDAYISMEDAKEILRMEEVAISEIAIRLKDFGKLHDVHAKLHGMLSGMKTKTGKPALEVHTWEKLSPFFNVARMIDIMTFFIKLMLIAIVLISIMNVMIMAVYERTKEIGTISAIGTMPRKILSMFVAEGFCLGILGSLIGNVIGLGIIGVLNFAKLEFAFGRQKGLILSPTIHFMDVLVISVIVVIVSVAASFQPAYRASKLEPIKALRSI